MNFSWVGDGEKKYRQPGQLTVCHKAINATSKVSAKWDVFYRKGCKRLKATRMTAELGAQCRAAAFPQQVTFPSDQTRFHREGGGHSHLPAVIPALFLLPSIDDYFKCF